jgi:CspA family cold shock protein
MPDDKIFTGTVTFWSVDKGFGFITPDFGDLLDIFVHASQLPGRAGKRNLARGQTVQFEIDALDGKIFAKNVKIIQARPVSLNDKNTVTEEVQI